MKANAQDFNSTYEKQLKDEASAIFKQILTEITTTKEFKKTKTDTFLKALDAWGNHGMANRLISKRIAKKFTTENRNAKFLPDTKIEDLELWANVGKLVTIGAKYMAQKDKTAPDRLAALMEKPLKDVLSNTDFGNLFEMTAVSEQRVMATRQMLQAIMGEFPTKTGILPAMKLKKANTNLKKKNLSLSAMQDMSPEMLVGTMANLVSALIETKEVALLLSQSSELIRKLHTGSVIQGEAGKSLIEMTLTEKLNEIIPDLNPVILRKAVVGIIEILEASYAAGMNALMENPDTLKELVSTYGSVKNSRIRKQRKKAKLFEEFFEEEENIRLSAKTIAEIDTQELGEVLNTWLQIMNTLHESEPQSLTAPISSLLSDLDPDELQKAAQWMVPGVINALKPGASAIMPSIVNGVCDLLTPSPGEDTEELNKALGNLRTILSNNGGQTL